MLLGGSKRRLSVDTTVESTIDRLTEALSQPVTVNIPRNPQLPADKANLFGNLIAAQLREIDPQFVDDIMLQIMQVITNAKRRQT